MKKYKYGIITILIGLLTILIGSISAPLLMYMDIHSQMTYMELYSLCILLIIIFITTGILFIWFLNRILF